MQIVIDIPEKAYSYIKREWVENDFDSPMIHAMNSIKNGTPLPEGHGRLITEPTEEEIAETIGGNNGFAECIREAVKAVFNNAKTLVPAEQMLNTHMEIQNEIRDARMLKLIKAQGVTQNDN